MSGVHGNSALNLNPSFSMFEVVRERNVKVIRDYGENFPLKTFFNFILIVYTIELSMIPSFF